MHFLSFFVSDYIFLYIHVDGFNQLISRQFIFAHLSISGLCPLPVISYSSSGMFNGRFSFVLTRENNDSLCIIILCFVPIISFFIHLSPLLYSCCHDSDLPSSPSPSGCHQSNLGSCSCVITHSLLSSRPSKYISVAVILQSSLSRLFCSPSAWQCFDIRGITLESKCAVRWLKSTTCCSCCMM